MNNIRILILISIVFLISGCSIKTAGYNPDAKTANLLNEYELNKVSIISKKNENLGDLNYKLPFRGLGGFLPAEGGNFTNFIVLSLKQQLQQNNLIDENSNYVIILELLENHSSMWDFSTNYYKITANFNVTKNEKSIYNRDITIVHTFPSSFVGQIAGEYAINNYPIAIRKLITEFLLDKDFLIAIEKRLK
ncbi:hypothetical protein CRU94_00710 [Arcobacter sp. AHV-9/2010]|uniref:hypothetical protein n=1 Tax=Arcobacter sp. AHV-9/2010 TaxID=2021861 RepID=UPI00100A32D9|nr:hypothetical protein [Arcobacter sp. CECT 9299]RXJ96668.1 hypothetical protein CRU94_00710 [Arcobacter sp. CECT 9299]